MKAIELAELALSLTEAGDGALAHVTRERSLYLRYARSRPTQATEVNDTTVELAVLRDGRVGRAQTNRTDEDSLRHLAAAATHAAESAARSAGPGSYPGFPSGGTPRAHEGYDLQTARLDPATGSAALAAAFQAAEERGVEAHGLWTAAETETAVASSAGVAVADRVTDAFMKAVCIAPNGRSGYAAGTGSAVSGIDAAALAARAADKAAFPGEPASLPPGWYQVVMERHALAELLGLLAPEAFNGLAHAEGRGALSGKLGTRVAAPSVNLSDSPRFRTTLPRAFDAEGVPKAPIPLIQDGVAHRVVHDTSSAAIAGAETTGHASVPGGSASGPSPTNLVMVGGGAADEAELCAPLRRGIYVTRLWYGNVVRPGDGQVTATTRDGTFLIEDGQVTRPLQDMRITDNVLNVLELVDALSARPELTSDGEFYGRRVATGTVCPAIRVKEVLFSA